MLTAEEQQRYLRRHSLPHTLEQLDSVVAALRGPSALAAGAQFVETLLNAPVGTALAAPADPALVAVAQHPRHAHLVCAAGDVWLKADLARSAASYAAAALSGGAAAPPVGWYAAVVRAPQTVGAALGFRVCAAWSQAGPALLAVAAPDTAAAEGSSDDRPAPSFAAVLVGREAAAAERERAAAVAALLLEGLCPDAPPPVVAAMLQVARAAAAAAAPSHAAAAAPLLVLRAVLLFTTQQHAWLARLPTDEAAAAAEVPPHVVSDVVERRRPAVAESLRAAGRQAWAGPGGEDCYPFEVLATLTAATLSDVFWLWAAEPYSSMWSCYDICCTEDAD